MEISGKQYLVAVEIEEVEFGHFKPLNGLQFVAEVEHALQTSGQVYCYDYAKKRQFEDTLLLVHEGPRQVKVVPRSKLSEYQKAGLVKGNSP